ncbi:MAG: permease [Enterococcus sp.]
MKQVKRYRWSIILFMVIAALVIWKRPIGVDAFMISVTNLKEMLLLVPPIFVLMGLMDVWIPKETLTKYMGKGSGVLGYLIALVLGSVAAGALYIAFPIASLLMKKGTRLSIVLFFLGVWSTSKLPVLLFEIASLGLPFTLIHVGVNLPLSLLFAFLIEKTEKTESVDALREKASDRA